MYTEKNQNKIFEDFKRNGFIDFLKFIFAIIILIHHSSQFYPILPIGYIGVEFFFLVTGWLMAKKFYNFEVKVNENIFVITRNYIARKIKVFYLEYLVAIVIGFIFICLFAWNEIPSISNMLALTIGDMLLLQIWGFPVRSITGVMWYLSAMIGAIFILLPIILKNQRMFINFIAPLVILISFGSIAYQYNYMGVIMEPLGGGFIHMGLIRAIADISLGYCLYFATEKINSINFTRMGLILIAMLEFLLYATIFYLIILVKKPSNADFIIVLFLSISLSFSFSKKSLLAVLFQKKFFNNLGLLSLNIFLNHFYVGWVIMTIKSKYSIEPYQSVIYYFLGSLFCITLNFIISRSLRKIEYKKIIDASLVKEE